MTTAYEIAFGPHLKQATNIAVFNYCRWEPVAGRLVLTEKWTRVNGKPVLK